MAGSDHPVIEGLEQDELTTGLFWVHFQGQGGAFWCLLRAQGPYEQDLCLMPQWVLHKQSRLLFKELEGVGMWNV